MSILFEHAQILATENDEFQWLKDAYLGVDGNSIDYIGIEKPTKIYDEIRDFSDKLLMPGMVNSHCHMLMTLLRGHGGDLPLHEWLFDKVFPVEDRMTLQDRYAGTELALLELISGGTTSVSDMHTYMANEGVIEMIADSGIKVNLCRPMQSFSYGDRYDTLERVPHLMELYNKFNGYADGRIAVDFSFHAEYTNFSEEVVRRYSEECLKHGGRMHIHLSETKREVEECIQRRGMTPPAWFLKMGTFESPTAAAHCVWLTPDDVAILAEKKVSVAHNPSSNMKLASGFAPMAKMQRAGINLAIGTDGASSNNNLNMFEELHLAAVINKGFRLDPTFMKSAECVKMVTRNGALLQGRTNTGMLAVGYRADVIALDLDRPHMRPNPCVTDTLCYTAQGSDVCMTMVDGKILYENGEYLTLDYEKIKHDVKASCARLGIEY